MPTYPSNTGITVQADHWEDENGNPAGGRTTGSGFQIDWQNGPLTKNHEVNGAFVEDIIVAAIDRIQYYNESKFRCRENSLAITHLEEALHWCYHRTRDRELRGVEGTHEV